MTVARTHDGHQTQYVLRDETGQRCILLYDSGEEGQGPAIWKLLLPGPAGTEDLYGVHEFQEPDSPALTAWLTPLVGQHDASEISAAVDDSPPAAAGWRHRPGA
jgi:hypothetical protein